MPALTSLDLDVPTALQALLRRHSLGVKHITDPGPTDAELALMAQAALRAPDHAELAPFRFALVRGAARDRLAALFEQVARDAGKDAAAAALDAERARRAPLTAAIVARIDLGHPLVPAHEQWMAVGGALAQFMTAAHLLGYAGKVLSGAKVRHPAVQGAFCGAGETLVGWIALGTALREPASGRTKARIDQVLGDW
jgi:nitroreductase